MKVVIDIPDKVMNSKEFCNYFGAWSAKLDEVVENGTVLPNGAWENYNTTFYKCPDCGYLLEKCCPNCGNNVILPIPDARGDI